MIQLLELVANIVSLSIIVPIGPNDSSWKNLISDLKFLSLEDEVLFVADHEISTNELPCSWKYISSPLGRAEQLNRGAQAARHEMLWFLHSDSRVSIECLRAVRSFEHQEDLQIGFFPLAFYDGPSSMLITQLGVWFRSQLLKIPFGDQGFCLSKKTFEHLGPYPTELQYGEDHVFIWRAHQMKIPVIPFAPKIYTSARKYQKNGWNQTTLNHLILTWQQAKPELKKLMRQKC